MNALSNLPPGVTDYDVERAAGAFDEQEEAEPSSLEATQVEVDRLSDELAANHAKLKSESLPVAGQVRFVADDPHGLWKAGDIAVDLGWESSLPESDPHFVPVRLLRLKGEILSITDPIRRGLVAPVAGHTPWRRGEVWDKTLQVNLPDLTIIAPDGRVVADFHNADELMLALEAVNSHTALVEIVSAIGDRCTNLYAGQRCPLGFKEQKMWCLPCRAVAAIAEYERKK